MLNEREQPHGGGKARSAQKGTAKSHNLRTQAHEQPQAPPTAGEPHGRGGGGFLGRAVGWGKGAAQSASSNVAAVRHRPGRGERAGAGEEGDWDENEHEDEDAVDHDGGARPRGGKHNSGRPRDNAAPRDRGMRNPAYTGSGDPRKAPWVVGCKAHGVELDAAPSSKVGTKGRATRSVPHASGTASNYMADRLIGVATKGGHLDKGRFDGVMRWVSSI